MSLGTATGLSREGIQYGAGVTGDAVEKNTAARQSATARGGDGSKAKKKQHASGSGFNVADAFRKADDAGKALIQEKMRLAAKGVDLTSLWDRVAIVIPSLFAALMAKNPEMELAF